MGNSNASSFCTPCPEPLQMQFQGANANQRPVSTSSVKKKRSTTFQDLTVPGTTELHEVAVKGNDSKAKQLVMFGGIKVDVKNEAGVTPFMLACKCGKLNTAKQLFQLGANPDEADSQGATALDMTKTPWIRSWLVGLSADAQSPENSWLSKYPPMAANEEEDGFARAASSASTRSISSNSTSKRSEPSNKAEASSVSVRAGADRQGAGKSRGVRPSEKGSQPQHHFIQRIGSHQHSLRSVDVSFSGNFAKLVRTSSN